ncbi:type II toxin-antitoxin system VapC family toxin [Candidatus Sumerlaeota bacterium]|nr:type II toxin-antitoxin system VapC family toxin [Candidatus Sumerlaeota bacterium]
MKYLLDTNICIYLIKKKPAQILGKMMKMDIEDIGISTITLSELLYGIEKSRHPERNKMALMEFLVPFAILDFDQNAAKEYGRIRASLERKGKIIGSMDMLIAAVARSHNLFLITNNVREFKRIEGLKIENWIGGE